MRARLLMMKMWSGSVHAAARSGREEIREERTVRETASLLEVLVGSSS